MFFYEGLSCPCCHKPFEITDDIVACPVCGAPHHRACWKEHGTCAHADDHGTDKQWTREGAFASAQGIKQHPCGNCGTDNSPYAEFCSHCGRPLEAEAWQSDAASDEPPHTEPPFGEYAPFRSAPPFQGGMPPYAGMAPNEQVGGEAVIDLAAVVQTNTTYYLPKFRDLARKNAKLSWNWAAFLIPSYWLLFRKQYLIGCLMLLLELAMSTLAMAAVLTSAAALGPVASYEEMITQLLLAAQSDPHFQSVVQCIGAIGVLLLLMRLLIAVFGNCLYLSHSLQLIRRSREQYPEGYRAQLSAAGGTSVLLAVIGYMCMQTLPVMILMLLGV